LAALVIGATILEVVLAAGIVGIYMDSFGEERWQRWRRIQKLAARRRARLTELRRKNFVGGYITRAMAEERVLRRLKKEKQRQREVQEVGVGSNDEPTNENTEPDTRSHIVAPFILAMPIAAKIALLVTLCSIFLRIGAVTFGGGFIMIPLIESEVVNTHQWLTHQEFADATALGQITPGPVLITATFIGYRVAGTLGALLATISVFLPAFLMTIAAGSSLRRFRSNRQVQSFLRGVTPAVVGLLVAAAWGIGRAGIHTWVGLSIAIVAVIVLIRFRPNPFWIIVGAGVLRLIMGLLVG
jgi:chromate transporter